MMDNPRIEKALQFLMAKHRSYKQRTADRHDHFYGDIHHNREERDEYLNAIEVIEALRAQHP
jgi:hypothetical protein